MSHDPRNDRADIGTDMHDPLCGPPWSYGRGGHCEGCDLIAKARADERERAVARLNAEHRQRRIRSVGRTIAAVRGES